MDYSIVMYIFDQMIYAAMRYFEFALGAFVLFYWLLPKRFLFRKIQPARPGIKKMAREVLFSLTSVMVFGVVAAFTFNVWDGHNQVYWNIDQHGWVYYGLSIIWVLVLHDTYFYWMHRLMHTRLVYRYVHRVHHRSTNPTPWSAYSFHPAEALLEAGVLPIIAFTLPVHFSVVAGTMLFQIGYNVYGHLGFEILPKGIHKTFFGRFINTSVAHNLHHSRFEGNYGLYFLIWDRMMGTLRSDYDATYESVTENTEQNKIIV